MRQRLLVGACAALSLGLVGCGEVREWEAEPGGAALSAPCQVGQHCAGRCCGLDEACVAGTCVRLCERHCVDRECGPDGCGGSCGTCPEPLVCQEHAGSCIACMPDCLGRECGPNGCGGSCGDCAEGLGCFEGTCLACVPECEGRECGGDGCGGHCGRCPFWERCEDGRCTCPPATVRLSYSGDLAPLEQRCTPAPRFEASCDVAIHEWCAGHGCADTGFGPVQQRGDSLAAVCLQAQLRKVPPGTLTRYVPGCPALGLASPSCTVAFHRLCRDHGHVSGFGPTSLGPFLVGVSCLDEARALKVPWRMLQEFGCTLKTAPGEACRFAAHRLCVALGYAAGFGPVDVFGEGVVVTCLQPPGGGPMPCRGGFACPPHLACCLGVCAPLGACGE